MPCLTIVIAFPLRLRFTVVASSIEVYRSLVLSIGRLVLLTVVARSWEARVVLSFAARVSLLGWLPRLLSLSFSAPFVQAVVNLDDPLHIGGEVFGSVFPGYFVLDFFLESSVEESHEGV